MQNVMIPLTRTQLHSIPGSQALAVSYDWPFGNGRYRHWIEQRREGWTLVCDYGKPETGGCTVTRRDSFEECAAEMTSYVCPNRAWGGENLTVDEWHILEKSEIRSARRHMKPGVHYGSFTG
ncbi:hypothetical protein ACFW9I_36695 [[Kitasatospora] papulosa]|uniref:hypothetical protein n=1 Tax=[Kitasatospora] papulosa TaxID=1464011 RepID=UPI0036B79E59